jgi:hypothetical protein
MWDGEAGIWRDAWAGTFRCDYPDCPEWATQGRTRHTGDSSIERREFSGTERIRWRGLG